MNSTDQGSGNPEAHWIGLDVSKATFDAAARLGKDETQYFTLAGRPEWTIPAEGVRGGQARNSFL
jgi:hypothetical protein